MAVPRLTNKDNSLLKTIRLVSSGSRRAPKELVVAEGVRVLEEVNRAGCRIEAVVFSEQFGDTERETDLLRTWFSKGTRLFKTDGKLFKSVSSVRMPQGALALVEVRERSLSEIDPSQNPLVVYACGIQDPGNLGTLIRAAAAAGATLICTTKGTVSAKNPKAIRASAGAFFQLPTIERVEPSAFRSYCDRCSIHPYRADAREGTPYTQVDLQSPAALLLGNEGSGLAEKELMAFPAIRIPMSKGVESLNVAAAGAILLFEAARQRYGGKYRQSPL